MPPADVLTLRRYLAAGPFHEFLGMELAGSDPERGEVTIRLPFRRSFGRLPDGDQIHGGVLSALIDIAGDFALILVLGHGVPTINLRVDYLRPAAGDLTATARVVRAGRTVGVVDIELKDAAGRLIAVGRGCYGTAAG